MGWGRGEDAPEWKQAFSSVQLMFDIGREGEYCTIDPKSWATGDKGEGKMILETTLYTGAAVRCKTGGGILLLYNTDLWTTKGMKVRIICALSIP